MCQLQQPDPNATGAPTPVNAGGGPVSAVTGPMMAPGAPGMKDTKLAKLLKISLPIVQGGAVGGFGGNWRQPGSGSEAAGNFFTNQAHQRLLKQEMGLRVAQAQSAEALRQSQETRNQFYDKNLQSEIEHRDFQEEHPKPEAEHATEVSGYPGTGMYTSGARAGTTFQMTRPSPRNPDGTMKDYSSYGAEGPVPLGPPESEKQLVMRQKQTEQDKADTRAEQEKLANIRETGENKRLQVREAGDDRRAAGRKAEKPDAGKVETYAGETLKAAGNDPDKALQIVDGLKTMPPEMKATVRARIREMAKPGRTGKGKAVDDAIANALKKRAGAARSGQDVGVPATP